MILDRAVAGGGLKDGTGWQLSHQIPAPTVAMPQT